MGAVDLTAPRAHVGPSFSKESKLDVLFNSGGVMFPPVEQLTADGFDLQFGTNVLGAWRAVVGLGYGCDCLTNQLCPT